MTEVVSMFNTLWTFISGILLPSTGLTPVAVLAWFGLVFPFFPRIVAFLKGLASGG
jgi:hypothetical protein